MTTQLSEADNSIRELQKEHKNLLNQIEALRSEKFRQDIDFQNMLQIHENFKKEKEDFEAQRLEVEKSKSDLELQLKSEKEKTASLEQKFKASIDVEKSKHNKLAQDNMQLKHNLEQSKLKELKIETELIDLLKKEHSQGMEFFQEFRTDMHPALVKSSLSQNLRSIQELESEIYDLKLVLVHEQQNMQNLQKLCDCLRVELEKSIEENQRTKENFEKEREKLYLSKAQSYCHKEFHEMFRDHISKCDKRQDCCSYEYIKELIAAGDEEDIKKLSNALQIQNKKDAINAIPKLIKERENDIRAQYEAKLGKSTVFAN